MAKKQKPGGKKGMHHGHPYRPECKCVICRNKTLKLAGPLVIDTPLPDPNIHPKPNPNPNPMAENQNTVTPENPAAEENSGNGMMSLEDLYKDFPDMKGNLPITDETFAKMTEKIPALRSMFPTENQSVFLEKLATEAAKSEAESLADDHRFMTTIFLNEMIVRYCAKLKNPTE